MTHQLIAIANLLYTFYKSKTTTRVTFAIPRLLAKHSTKFGVRCAQNGASVMEICKL